MLSIQEIILKIKLKRTNIRTAMVTTSSKIPPNSGVQSLRGTIQQLLFFSNTRKTGQA